MSQTTPDEQYEVLIVGGGVAGLSAATYTARASLDTVVVDAGEPIIKRNAHLENMPGFPAGVNPRLFLDMLRSQATRNGVDMQRGTVDRVEFAEDDDSEDAPSFVATVERDSGETQRVAAEKVIAASWPDPEYLEPLGVEVRDAGSKAFVQETEGRGRTNVEGVYAAGRLAERYHQAVVAAGHGAETAITLIHDSNIPFYHDWVVPEGYFSDRGREVPPGCEEISETERRAREQESMAAMQEYFDEPHEERQRTHTSLVDDEYGRVPEDE
ncbi:NAD(P)/FAD-dependent oxidoreductase [Haloparvum sp. AD34]